MKNKLAGLEELGGVGWTVGIITDFFTRLGRFDLQLGPPLVRRPRQIIQIVNREKSALCGPIIMPK